MAETEKRVVIAGATGRMVNDTANTSVADSGWSSRRLVLGASSASQADRIVEINKRLRGVVRVGSSSSNR